MRRAPALLALALLAVGGLPAPSAAVDEPAARAAAAWFRATVLDDGIVGGRYSAAERAEESAKGRNMTASDAALIQWIAPGVAPLEDDLRLWRKAPSSPSPVDWWRARPWASSEPYVDDKRPGSNNPCNDWSRAVLALAALGEDPRTFGGTDHVAKVLACHRGDGTWDDPTVAADDGWLNNDVFALLALRAAGFPASDPVVAATVDALLRVQHADGGFGMHGEPHSLVDDTAMATTALLSVLPPSHDGPRRALVWLETVQLPNGGYVYLNRESPESAAVVLEAVLAADEDPDAGRWRKAAGSLESNLRSYQVASGPDAGAFARDRGGTRADVLTTYLALRALSGGALPVTLPTVRVEAGPAVADREAALRAEASVPVGRIASWTWDLGDGAAASGERVGHTYRSPGTHRVAVTVATDRGVERTARVLVDVLPADRLPLDVARAARRGDAVEARVDALAGSVVRFEWGDGNATEWSTVPNATHAYARLGTYVVRAEARDPSGQRSTGEATLVVENAHPVLLVPSTHAADRVAPARLVAAAADPDGPAPRVVWTFPDGAELEGAAVERRFAALGESVVRVTAVDADGGVTEAETRVLVGNVPPTVALAAPALARTGDTVLVRAEAADADGPPPHLAWTLPEGASSAGGAATWPAAREGEWTIEVTATDADGAVANASARVRVLPELPEDAPLALAATLDPARPRAGDEATLLLAPSGGRPPYALRAVRDGVEVPVVEGRAALGAVETAVRWVAEARDAAGALARVEGDVTPAPDLPPAASVGVATDGRTVVADATGSRDPESRPLAYRFLWGDGEATPWGPDALAAHTYAEDGTYAIEVETVDLAGHVARARVGVLVAAPRIAAPEPSSSVTVPVGAGREPTPVAALRETPPREAPGASLGALAAALAAAAALPPRGRAAPDPSRARTRRR